MRPCRDRRRSVGMPLDLRIEMTAFLHRPCSVNERRPAACCPAGPLPGRYAQGRSTLRGISGLGKQIRPRKANSAAESPILPGGNPCQKRRADGDCASRRTSTKIATRAGVDNFTPVNCKSNSSQPMASARASGQPLGCYFLNTLAALFASSHHFRVSLRQSGTHLDDATSDAVTRLICGV